MSIRDAESKVEWDSYWSRKSLAGGKLYDFIAEIYRRVLIRPLLNKMIRRHFASGFRVLHAGCGSGQVDKPIRDFVQITALDISPNALELYRSENGESSPTILGSVFEIPLPNGSIDGVYNLGVMEHFSEEEILRILREFARVLRPGGKAVLFWPPEFGASVLFFKALKLFFAKVLNKPNVKFHPDEICRLRSREHGNEVLSAAGLKPCDYYFGPKDFFTYAVVVGEKR